MKEREREGKSCVMFSVHDTIPERLSPKHKVTVVSLHYLYTT